MGSTGCWGHQEYPEATSAGGEAREHGAHRPWRTAASGARGAAATGRNRRGERGRGGVEAHSGAVEEVSELGEGLVTTGGRRRSRWPEEEEDVGDGAPGLPASHGLVETKKKVRRFFWRHRRGEGWSVAAANSVGGDGCARHERERETEEWESSGESEGVRGGRVASPGSSGGKQGGRRWPKQGGGGRGAWPRAPGACPSSWQRRKATGEARVGWAGQGGSWAGWWLHG